MGGSKLSYLGLTVWCDPIKVKDLLIEHCDYMLIGGIEICPETKKSHCHALLYSKTAKCWTNLIKPLAGDIHMVAVAKPYEYSEYCIKTESKESTESLIYFEKGLKPKSLYKKEDKKKPLSNAEILDAGLVSLVREDRVSVLNYERYKKSVDRFLLDTTKLVDADAPKGVWIYGEPGVGKSYSVRQKYPDLYLKPQNKWWDGYAGQKVVLLDDFDTNVLGHYLKIWGDAYGFNAEVKSGTIPINYDKFIITSNFTPFQLFADKTPECWLVQAIERRFKFVTKTSIDHDISNDI